MFSQEKKNKLKAICRKSISKKGWRFYDTQKKVD